MSNIFNQARANGNEALSDAAAFAEGEIGAHQRLVWSAAIGGSLTGLVVQLVLSLLGLGIGLSAAPGVTSFSIGTAIWLLLCAIIAYGVGGYISARLSGGIALSAAGYQGLVTWALTTIVALTMLTTAVGSILGGTLSAVSGAFGGAGSAVAGAVKTIAPTATGSNDPLAAILDQLKASAKDPTNAAVGDDVMAAVKSALSSDPGKRGQVTEQAAMALARAKHETVDQARDEIEGYERQFDDLKTQAKTTVAKVGSEAADTASGATLGAAVSLILGAIAAFFAARFGSVGVGRRLVSAD